MAAPSAQPLRDDNDHFRFSLPQPAAVPRRLLPSGRLWPFWWTVCRGALYHGSCSTRARSAVNYLVVCSRLPKLRRGRSQSPAVRSVRSAPAGVLSPAGPRSPSHAFCHAPLLSSPVVGAVMPRYSAHPLALLMVAPCLHGKAWIATESFQEIVDAEHVRAPVANFSSSGRCGHSNRLDGIQILNIRPAT